MTNETDKGNNHSMATYLPDGRKICNKCKLPKDPSSDFHNDTRCVLDGKVNWCKSCVSTKRKNYYQKNRKKLDAMGRRWRKANRDKTRLIGRRARVKSKYGMSLETYLDMKKKPCGICGKKPKNKKHIHIDHCHDTNKIRDVLCSTCNIGIGMLRHSTQLLHKAILYLEKHS